MKLFDCLLMQESVVLVEPIDAGEVVHVQEVHTRPYQAIDRVVVAEDSLLLFVPLRLRRRQTHIVYPVLCRLDSHDFDIFFAPLEKLL